MKGAAKKEVMDVYFVNKQKTEKLNIKLLRTVSRYARQRKYHIVVKRYPTDGIRFGTLFHTSYQIEVNVVEELMRAIKKYAYAEGMILEFYWIDTDVKHRAKIFLTPPDMFEENLEKLAEYL